MTLINREDAIDELRHLIPYRKYHRGEWVYLLEKKEVFKTLNSLPSIYVVKQESNTPKGKWSEDCKCTICGFEDESFGLSQIIRCNFCPNCGARMI